MIVNFDKASRKLFLMNGANSLQFSLKAKVLPSNNLEISQLKAVGNSGNLAPFQRLVSYEYSHA